MDFLNLLLSIITLTILEIVLGIDNLVFLSILIEKLPKAEHSKARFFGLTLAWVTRLMLLLSAVYIVTLSKPLFVISDINISIRSIVLLLGGAFLIAKATEEIHVEMRQDEEIPKVKNLKKVSLKRIVVQIALMDIIFSFDSVLTAIGLTSNFWVMAAAITIAILVMIYASKFVCEFIEKYSTIKMLALSFLILIGTLLIADGLSFHVPRGYLYFAMGFSFLVETLNIIKRSRKRRL